MSSQLEKKNAKKNTKANASYFALSMPGMLSLLFITIVPCFGLLLAFKEYNYVDGILGSPWVGFDNFIAFFKTNDFVRVLGNTLFYNITWTLVINIGLAAVVAIMLYDVRNKYVNKLFQTCLLIPGFVSSATLSYVAYTFLAHENGILNRLFEMLGMDTIMWYNEAQYWPLILTIVQAWSQMGLASLYFYSAMLSIDTQVFEAASIDGAGKFRQIWHIAIPELLPMVCMVLITRMGVIMSSGVEPFYSLTLNSSALYETTDVLGTYLYRGLSGSSLGITTAISLFQNVVGVILLVTSNTIVKKINEDMALY